MTDVFYSFIYFPQGNPEQMSSVIGSKLVWFSVVHKMLGRVQVNTAAKHI